MQTILSFISSKETGVSTEEIQKEFASTSLQEIAQELNTLSKDGLLDIFRTKTGIFYRRNRETHKFTSSEEKIVYLLIKESTSEGIWIKDLKTKSGLHQNLITKVIKALEQRMIIKSVKSVMHNRKVYMLYEEVPSENLGDGPWFTPEADLDTGFVEAIKSVVCEWVSAPENGKIPSFTTLPECKDVHQFIIRSGISSVPLTASDVSRILDILVYERKLIKLTTRYLRNTQHPTFSG
ncbi:DNA-directed RNA polymerase III subunit RPC6 [Nematocida displodere]|uniref:DNA-directed RNA polymerase III subunit RPC6 n=1 Tax=Nematocida displodere TaxID=1805483 RepID=A0A177EGX9_9MICR|nr:DNA-directed RNA polymerase III subunit RPC6 [Nematocida displodere]